MCSDCQIVCGCEGGEVFGMCPCSKGFACSVCGHDPIMPAADPNPGILNEILAADVIERERAAFESQQQG